MKQEIKKSKQLRIVAVSDLHGSYPDVGSGDILIIAGDLTARDTVYQLRAFDEWLLKQDFRHKIVVAGNHDGSIEKGKYTIQNGTFLNDSHCIIEGLKIYGSPWTRSFGLWSFMKPESELKAVWNKIPNDTDILVCHSPAYGILDMSHDECLGCYHLRNRIEKLHRLKMFICGHIHEGYGKKLLKCPGYDILCLNAAHMDGSYNAVNEPHCVDLSV